MIIHIGAILSFSSPQCLNDVMQYLKTKVVEETHEYHVRRSEVFNDLMRETRKRAYSPFKYVKTYFVGEPGKDTGGLTRELWCLFARHLQQSLCEGKENCRVVRHDAAKLQVIIYIWVVLHNLSLTYRRVFTEEWECSWEYQLFRVALVQKM